VKDLNPDTKALSASISITNRTDAPDEVEGLLVTSRCLYLHQSRSRGREVEVYPFHAERRRFSSVISLRTRIESLQEIYALTFDLEATALTLSSEFIDAIFTSSNSVHNFEQPTTAFLQLTHTCEHRTKSTSSRNSITLRNDSIGRPAGAAELEELREVKKRDE